MEALRQALADVAPTTLWALSTRLLGAVYLISFVSIFRQIVALAGPKGISPIGALLDQVRRDYPAPQRYLWFPTLFWFSSSARALRIVTLGGACAAVLVIVGDPACAWPALLVCAVVNLSCDRAVDHVSPWDCFLLEAGFLYLLADPVRGPLPIVAFAARLLVVRLMLGFAKHKFLGGTRKDRGYLREFYIAQPIAHPIGWLAHRLPHAVQVLSLAGLWVIEVVAPFAVFAGGEPRALAGLFFILLMLGIQATSNFGYFNVVVIAVCVPLFDVHARLLDQPVTALLHDPADLARSAAAAVVIVAGVLCFPFNSWCASTWPFWPALVTSAPLPLRVMGGFIRALAPLRLVHSYGVFPPQGQPPVKHVPVLEGTRDFVTWHTYEYWCLPSTPTSRPRFAAPHYPRLDHAMFYEGVGMNAANQWSSLFGAGHPYAHSRHSPLRRLAERLLEGDSPVKGLFRVNPFPDPAAPPLAVRARCFVLDPTTPGELRATGRWWRRRLVGPHLPELRRDDDVWREWPPPPELFHLDDSIWRDRCPRLRAFARRVRPPTVTVDDVEAAVAHSLGVDRGVVTGLWTGLLPLAPPPAGSSWEGLPAAVGEVRARFTRAQLRDFERVLGLLTLGLLTRWEAHLQGKARPALTLPSTFHQGLCAHHVIGQGREAYARALADLDFMVHEASVMTDASGAWLLGLFRLEEMALHARTIRVNSSYAEARFIPGLPGFLGLCEFLQGQLQGPLQDDAPEQPCPVVRDIDTGAWRVVVPAEDWEP